MEMTISDALPVLIGEWPDHPSEEQKSSAHPKDDEKLKDKIGGQHCSFRDATWSERFALVLV